MGNGFKSNAEVKAEEEQKFEEYNESRRVRGMKMLDPPKDTLEAQERSA